MGQTKRVAKHRRPTDGALVLRVEARTFFDLDEAAAALALIYAGQPLRAGVNPIQRGLVDAVHQRVLERPTASRQADPETVAQYRQQLIDLSVFPDPGLPATDQRATPRQTKRVARYQRSDGTPLLRVDAPTFFDLEEAATALAMIYADQPVRTGLNSIQSGMTDAARDRVLERPGALKTITADAVANYRQALLDLGVFPNSDEPRPHPIR